MIRFLTTTLTLLLLSIGLASAQNVPENLTLKEIFMEPVIPGIRPDFEYFSSSQDSIYFSWNDSSYFEDGLYVMDLEGNGITKTDDETPRPLHSPNGSKIAYIEEGGIVVANADGSEKRQIVRTLESEYNMVWSPDNNRIAYVRDGDVWVSHVSIPETIQITEKSDDDPNFSISSWAGNSRLVLTQSDYSGSRTIYFPEYAGEFVTPGETSRGIPETSIFIASLDSTVTDTLLTGLHRSSVDASANGQFVAIDYADAALKHRKIITHNLEDGTETVVFEDSTSGWLSGRELEFAPEGEKLLFLSERNGWNHIYSVEPDGSNLTQHTRGNWEVSFANWLDGESVVYAGNRQDYGERHIYVMNITDQTEEKLTREEAYRYQFQLSPDRSNLIYAKTFFNQPFDLYRLDLDNPGEEIQLTNSVPDSFYTYNWQQEQYVRFAGRDGQTDLSMSVLYPKNFDESQTYPVVVFVHGAGSLQNVYKGWSNNYWREYMFNQYLNLNGYIVVEIDYRHSLGYGRKFREDVTNWMGKYETEDIVDGLDWLQEHTGGALDLDNVGIYGGSYGGFMALYALTAEPDRFHAGAALRKVSNWRNYYYANPWYTLPRLGDPEEVPEHYDRSSPLTYASELERPALLLHGLVDDNVGAQDAFQYAEELIQNGNENFEMMIYPTENHGFTSPNSWYDEYRRIFEFFEEHLK